MKNTIRRAILIEFNELSDTLLQKFMDEGSLPAFKSFYETSTVYTTTAGDDPLEPWVQWPTVHCGVPYDKHRALHLGDGAKIEQKAMGTVLADEGIPVGIMGMMNGNYKNPRGYYVADPWDDRSAVHPAELKPFFDFVSESVRENTRETSMSRSGMLAFLWFMVRNGLSLVTVIATVRQLVAERLRPQLAWKRVAILDLFQYDLFRHLNLKYGIRFATFFSNSTAHLQHYFWRDMDPTGFEEQPDPGADRSLREAVRFGYRAMDRLLARIVRDHPDHRLMICTGLSQRPWYETTKCTYRPIDFERFLRFANVSADARVIPVMAERFRLECSSESEALVAADALSRITFRGATLMRSEVNGTTVHTGCAIYDPDPGVSVEQVTVDSLNLPFGSLFYKITAMNSGQHDRHGSFWLQNGLHRTVPAPIPLAAIAPTILRYFGIDIPLTMNGDLALAEE